MGLASLELASLRGSGPGPGRFFPTELQPQGKPSAGLGACLPTFHGSQLSRPQAPGHHTSVPFMAGTLAGGAGHNVNHHPKDQSTITGFDLQARSASETIRTKINHPLTPDMQAVSVLRPAAVLPGTGPVTDGSRDSVLQRRENRSLGVSKSVSKEGKRRGASTNWFCPLRDSSASPLCVSPGEHLPHRKGFSHLLRRASLVPPPG